jgi:hypothetical protein
MGESSTWADLHRDLSPQVRQASAGMRGRACDYLASALRNISAV